MLVTPAPALTTAAMEPRHMADAEIPTIVLTYKYRLLPTKRQHAALAQILEDQRQLYNAALEERIDCYRKTGRSISYAEQCKSLTEWRTQDSTASSTAVKLQRWTLHQLDLAYQSFFRRLKSRNGKAGYPRYRSVGRWRSFGFKEMQGISLSQNRLKFKGLAGSLRVHLHRPIPDGADIRACTFGRDAKGWFVCFQIKMEAVAQREVRTAVGLDLGLSVFAYQSDGIAVPSQRIERKSERKMRIRQRALSRCKKGSKRRSKMRRRLAKMHAKIANTRSTWMHQQSAQLVRRYDLIVAEALNVAGMIKHPNLARSIADASWSRFLGMVAYKAERAGGQLKTVSPRNTSQKCSSCSELVPKSLAVRMHSCPSCGLVIDRDHNASLNILQAVVGLGQPNVTHRGERAAGNIALIETTKRGTT